MIAEAWKDATSQKNQWSDSYLNQVERTQKLHAYPTLGDKPISSIKDAELEALLEYVYSKGDRKPARTVALLLRQWISAIFRFAVRKYGLENDPTGALRDEFSRPRVTHHPTLKKGEIRGFGVALEAYKGNTQTKIALKLLLLTGSTPTSRTRPYRLLMSQEVCHAKAKDILTGV